MSSPAKLHQSSKIDAQARTHLLTPDPTLDRALANSAAAGLPAITISDLQGQYLAIQCRLMNAKTVLEVGTLGGYSTIWFARAGCAVTSIEIDPRHRDVAVANTAGLDVDVVLGAALDVMPRFVEEGRVFDFVFIDAAWGEQWECFEWAVRLTRPGGCVYVDNVVRELLEGGDVGGGETLLTRVGRMENVTATLVTTLSSHKPELEDRMDGFLIAVVGEAR